MYVCVCVTFKVYYKHLILLWLKKSEKMKKRISKAALVLSFPQCTSLSKAKESVAPQVILREACLPAKGCDLLPSLSPERSPGSLPEGSVILEREVAVEARTVRK